MFRVLISAVAMSALLGCSPATLVTTFDPTQAAYINDKGSGTITGQAFLRRNDGIVVYAAGSEVNLIPKTTYSDERIAAIYGSGKLSMFGRTFKNDDPEYYKYSRRTVANGEGRFTFTDVPDGDYYVTTQVIWQVQYSQQGGALMERVQIKGGKPVEIIMTGI